MKLKNPILFILLCFFIFINILDSITALFILPGEANPIYLFFGNIWIIYILKIIAILIFYHWYKQNKYDSHFAYYMLLMILVMVNLLLSFGVLSNIYGILNPQVVAESANIPVAQKVEAYSWFVLFIYIIPLTLSLFGFKLYEWSLKYVKIGKTNYKNRKWWQIWKM